MRWIGLIGIAAICAAALLSVAMARADAWSAIAVGRALGAGTVTVSVVGKATEDIARKRALEACRMRRTGTMRLDRLVQSSRHFIGVFCFCRSRVGDCSRRAVSAQSRGREVQRRSCARLFRAAAQAPPGDGGDTSRDLFRSTDLPTGRGGFELQATGRSFISRHSALPRSPTLSCERKTRLSSWR